MHKQGNIITHGDWQAELGKGFTLRQLQPFLGLANDESAKQIAGYMHVQAETVSKYMAAVMFKTQCHKSAGALAKLIKQGVLTPLMLVLAVLFTTPHDSDRQSQRLNHRTTSRTVSSYTARSAKV